jgi:twitching motility protein PilT
MVNEIMGSNLRVRESIALGENENRTFYDIIEASSSFGWTTFDQSILRAFEADLITEDTALLYATRKGRLTQTIDGIKKQRGLLEEKVSGLRLDMANAPQTIRAKAASTPPPLPSTPKP